MCHLSDVKKNKQNHSTPGEISQLSGNFFKTKSDEDTKQSTMIYICKKMCLTSFITSIVTFSSQWKSSIVSSCL